MSVTVVGSFSLLDLNLAAATTVAVVPPLISQLDLTLNGTFGLGALQTDISAQFNAALETSVSLQAEISDPFAAIQSTLEGLMQLQANLTSLMSAGLPTFSAELNAGISAQASVTGALGAKLGGISGLISAGVSAQGAVTSFIGDLQASLGAGPVFLVALQGDDLATSGAALDGLFSGGLDDGGNQIQPTDVVYGIVLVTKSPSAWAAIQATMRTG